MVRMSSPLSAVSAGYIEDLYDRFRANPGAVDESWRCLFGVLDLVGECTGADMAAGLAAQGADGRQAALIEALRRWGHLSADLNPLAASAAPDAAALAAHMPPDAAPVDDLAALYCGSLAIETAHIDDPGLRNWLTARFEAPPSFCDQNAMLRDLIRADAFERFMARKFPTKKRFGAEGAEAVIVLLRAVLRQAAASGVTHVVIGSMHRGRLNIMATILGRSAARLFAEIKGAHPFPADAARPGDVPYHLGDRAVIDTGAGMLDLTLLANPSHLEAVDPVVLGRARALQDGIGAARVLPIILHTDAAVIGQGVVAETLQLGGTAGFTTGGTVHIVINNQLGFTTEPSEARTSTYCTGAWKAIDSCILHVNGDDVAAASRAAHLAVDWRQSHARDAVIDFVCYRRNGHNEIDEPTFTQPVLYRQIAQQETVTALTARRLVAAGLATVEDIAAEMEACRAALAEASDASADHRTNESGYPAMPCGDARPTGVPTDRLIAIADHLAQPPDGMAMHPKMGRLLRQRAVGQDGIAWPVAEALAFGSLLQDGVDVRFTGQDVVRGAFSHRHYSLVDGLTGAAQVALAALPGAMARLSLHNSPLSEYAVLGFEYGYSLGRLDALTVWEAQFGDFANGAQIILDQFIAAAEEKWCTPSGLVVLLPHGLEGQGPEHSSARLERFLQMAAGANMRIASPSTPANYFHLLRRQVCAPERRPLIVMSPKRLLRLPAALSPLAVFAPDRGFEPVVVNALTETVDRILLCTGKIAYDLEAERAARGAAQAAVVRIEELFPLPAEALVALFRRWPGAACIWVQEEPANMGAWSWLDRRIERLRRDAGAAQPTMFYAGRAEAGSPAGSFHGDHDADQAAIVAAAFDMPAPI
jgi:2-oxoglutarate dehydrogenase E1 component